MKVIQIQEAELERLRDELLMRLELSALKSHNTKELVPYDAVHYQLHRLVDAIKAAP